MKKKIKHILSFSPYGIYEMIRDKKIRTKRIKLQKKIIDSYIKNNEIKKLQIGCGTNILEGWLNTDLNCIETIVYLDAGEKFPIESGIFDFVYSEHLFEHLKVEQQLNMLKESYRILKKGGIIRIATPSLEFLFNLYANPNTLTNKQYVNWAVLNIPNLKVLNIANINIEEYYEYVINNFFKAWGHQMIHSYKSIKALALQCGYSKVKQVEVGKSDISFFQNIEKHGTIIPAEINIIETMVIEIIK